MSANQSSSILSPDIDALLQNTWLQAISLRHGPEFEEGGGRRLWERCVADVEQVQQALRAAGMDEASCRHILIAQCALLDEAVKSRGSHDDACMQWYDIPLQGHFLGTIEAGDTLCGRMRELLREPAPDLAVLTCFHRVMMLGFLGEYRTLNDPDREKLLKALTERVPPFAVAQSQPVLAAASRTWAQGGFISSWPIRLGVSLLGLAALWWGLNRWLDHLLATLLPGAMP
ncbi:type VI secretion system protein TssL, short form [Nissabacter sp. SGAir0207]|uniref:type VI secretion system protein TssL, short form n=1 Tax=Nissabacter sp. SGAir0207 TaxID=2126321 RepID=UPI0010CD0D6D|nr:type VI secretion system protein TssL, short form [Nissabacter sp. SGAir0207]QCR36003.1 DotU family type IV/VI secretion system protein [Nissabacter sp. SGAir0207]